MIRRYSRGLLYLLRRRTGDEALALDIRQDAFCIALEKLRSEPLDNPQSLAAYLRRTAINLLSADHRKAIRRRTDPDSELVERAADDGAGPFENVSREEAAKAIRALLEELRVPRDREILVRLYLRMRTGTPSARISVSSPRTSIAFYSGPKSGLRPCWSGRSGRAN